MSCYVQALLNMISVELIFFFKSDNLIFIETK